MKKHALTGAILLLSLSGQVASAQPNDAEFRREVLERLERIERRLGAVQGSSASSSGEGVTIDAEVYCSHTDCLQETRQHCARAGFRIGVPVSFEMRPNSWGGTQRYATRVTCLR